jgi:hypothetical protein
MIACRNAQHMPNIQPQLLIDNDGQPWTKHMSYKEKIGRSVTSANFDMFPSQQQQVQ